MMAPNSGPLGQQVLHDPSSTDDLDECTITNTAYPVLTFRWLAVHALAVPTVFFLGAILAMQFI